MTILDAMQDPALFGPWFASPSWRAWRVCLAALFGLPMSDEDAAIFTQHTGRDRPPTTPAREAWIICGRRAGKSRTAALVAVFQAAFRNHRAYLAPGEVATIPIVAVDRRQARTVYRYALALLREVPMLRSLIVAETREGVELSNGARLEIHTSNFRSARSYTSPCAVIDEPAFMRSDESAAPDRELAVSLRYAMASIADPLLVAISSPWARRGLLYEMHQRSFGKEGDCLVWQADSKSMNPLLSDRVIAAAYAEDSVAAASEFGAAFRGDLETFIDLDTLHAAVVPDRDELPPASGRTYLVAADAALGSGKDSFTACVAHRSADRIVIDKLIEITPPFRPSDAIATIMAAIAPYRVSVVYSDRFAKDFVTDLLRAYRVKHELTEFNRSEAYLAALPFLTGGRVELLDPRVSPLAKRCIAQFANLERRTAGSGKDSVDHPRRGGMQHDDVANVCALAVAMLGKQMMRRLAPFGGAAEHIFSERAMYDRAAASNSGTRARSQDIESLIHRW